MSYRADITIIGAGVIGLGIAARLAREGRDVFVLEKNASFGQETSSRHSGVIHSGIYYPEGSFKAKMCVAGNRILYELCEEQGIGHKKPGKLIVATNDAETGELQKLLEKGRKNGADYLRMLSKHELNKMEPEVNGVAALLSPSTGVIDAHALMQYFIAKAQEHGTQIAYHTRVVGIEKTDSAYKVTVEDDTGKSSLVTKILINCAGLYSDSVAELAGIDITKAGYRLHYCKGEYYSVSNSKSKLVHRLIYPVPPPGLTGVGIHITFDLEGRMFLGPSIQYVDTIDYAIDSENKQFFYESVKKLLPFIESDDLEPEMAGIRPKLQGPGEDIKDFVIRDESDKGLPGFINLIGIESPGLTASPAIAEYVESLVEDILGK